MSDSTEIEWAALALGEFEEWQERALCAQTDPELFYPDTGHSGLAAKRVCNGWKSSFGVEHAGCEVRAECLAYALRTEQAFGIWGGLSERERRRLKPRGTEGRAA